MCVKGKKPAHGIVSCSFSRAGGLANMKMDVGVFEYMLNGSNPHLNIVTMFFVIQRKHRLVKI
jgi:hypothetical protein